TAAPRIKFHVPVSSGNTVNSNANKIAYVTANLAAATHFLERSRNTIGHAMRHGRTRFINPPVPPVIIMVLTVTVKNSFVLGSVGITALLSNFSVVTAASIRQSPPFQNVSSTRPCQEAPQNAADKSDNKQNRIHPARGIGHECVYIFPPIAAYK